jgi:group I intron endonuclease
VKAPLPENDTRPRFIYLLTNKKNGKQYVGQSVDVDSRWRGHKLASKQDLPEMIIDRAIKKYGADGFTWEVIAGCRNLDDINNTENLLIKQYGCQIPNGYNVSPGGMQAPVHEKTRRLISKAHKGKHHSPETEFRKGHKPSPETIERAAAANRGRAPWNKDTNGVMKANETSFKFGQSSWLKGTNGIVDWGFQEGHTTTRGRKWVIDEDGNNHLVPPEESHNYESGMPQECQKNTFQSGENHPGAKLKSEQVLEIVRLYQAKLATQDELAMCFNVSKPCIKRIVYGQTWSHLTGIQKK